MPKTTPTPRELRDAYDRGENIIQLLNGEVGDPPGETSIELSYDLQSGGYVEAFDARAEVRDRKKVFMGAVKSIIDDLGGVESVLDAGVGEGTTLWSFLSQFENPPPIIHGSDLCWSRLAVCRDWLARQTPRLNVDVVAASLSEMPYQDNSFDLVYTVHSIEPNRGREQEIIHELFRVAGKYLVLIEPAYELANEEARQRMDQHNFCRGLAEVVKELDGEVIRDGLFEKGVNPLNPSAIYVIVKNGGSGNCEPRYACPVYKTPISVFGDCFYSPDSMRAYPILGGIPVLRSSQGIIASRFEDFSQGGGN